MFYKSRLFLGLLAAMEVMAQDPTALMTAVQARQEANASSLVPAAAPPQADQAGRALPQQAGTRTDPGQEKALLLDESERTANEIRLAKAKDRGSIRRFAADLFEARQAGTTATQQLAAIKAHRVELKAKRETLAAILLPVVALMGLVAVVVLAFLNVRERLQEIGLFLALGIRSTTLLAAFLLKALVTGLAGGLIGVALALLGIAAWRGRVFDGHGPAVLLDWSTFSWLLVGTPVFAALAAWVPSFWASRRDPAEVLRHD